MNLPEWLKVSVPALTPERGVKEPGFIKKNLEEIASLMRWMMDTEESAGRRGLLQTFDPRARILGILFLVVATAVTGNTIGFVSIMIIILLLSYLSSVGITDMVGRVLPSFVFTGVMVLPALLSIVTPGTHILTIMIGTKEIGITYEGLRTAGTLLVRVTMMVSLVALLLLTTRQADLFTGLRGLPVPAFLVTALFMAFRYIFILLRMAEDVNLARRSRTIDHGLLRDTQGWFASRIAFFVERSMKMAEDISMAMCSRGFTGEIKGMDMDGMKRRDYLWLGGTSFVFFIILGLY